MRQESEDPGGKLLSLELTPKCGLNKLFSVKLLVFAGKKSAFLSFLFQARCTLYRMKIALRDP
jgi:hypothetical protein